MEEDRSNWNYNGWNNNIFCMNRQIRSLLNYQFVHYAFYAVMGLIVAIPIIGSILKSGVDCDSAYYICIAERITEGYVPYETIRIGYTPLWMYIMAAFKMLFHIPNGLYWPYLLLFYLFEVGGTYFLFKLILSFGIKKSIALFSSFLYLLMCHWLQGNDVLLEVPCMTFCILACWLVVVFNARSFWHYIWIGGLAACSFLVKQYGLGTVMLCIYLMLFIGKCNWKHYAAFLIGYVLPICLCLIIWKDSFFNCVLLNGYGTQSAVAAGRVVSWSDRIMSMFSILNYFCYMICPVVYFGWLFVPLTYREKRLAYLTFAYCGIFGYSLVFLLTGGSLHYYQNLLPFAVVLMAELLHLAKCTKWWKYVTYVLIGWVILVSSYKTYYNRVYKQYINGTQKNEQLAIAHDVMQYVKEDETIFAIHGGLTQVYFLANRLPPNINTIGYTFGPLGLNENTAMEQIQSADWVIRFSKDYVFESFFTDSLKHYLEQYPAISLQDSTILLHKMH